MSVSSVREIAERSGGWDLISNNVTAVRAFNVTCSLASDDFNTIRYSGMIPALGSGHPKDLNLIAKRYECSPKVGNFVHLLKVHYDNIPPSQQGLPKLAEEWQPNPLLRRVSIEGKTVKRRVPWTRGHFATTATEATWANGAGAASLSSDRRAILTTALEPIEGLEREESDFGWDVEYNVYPLPFWLLDYEDTINNAPVSLRGLPTPIPKWCLRLSGFRHSDLLSENVTPFAVIYYYRVQFEILYRRATWVRGIPDRGFKKLVSGVQKDILVDGVRTQVPILLDGSGAVLSSPSMTNVQYRWVSEFPEANFGVLNLL